MSRLEHGILRQGLDEAHGDFWQGVGYYHSHDPVHKATYLQAVLKQLLRLKAASDRQAAIPPTKPTITTERDTVRPSG